MKDLGDKGALWLELSTKGGVVSSEDSNAGGRLGFRYSR